MTFKTAKQLSFVSYWLSWFRWNVHVFKLCF